MCDNLIQKESFTHVVQNFVNNFQQTLYLVFEVFLYYFLLKIYRVKLNKSFIY